MTTKTYKLSYGSNEPIKTIPNEFLDFERCFEENELDEFSIPHRQFGLQGYDINDTYVLAYDDNSAGHVNLRITGLKKNIDKTEKEIKSKGFNLEEISLIFL